MLQRQKNSPIDKLLTCKFWGGAAVKLEPEMIEIYWHFHKISSNILRNTSISMKKKMMMALEHFFVTLFEKSNFCPKIQFWQNANIFTSLSPKFFLTIFLVKSKLSTAKKSKTTTFSRVFQPKKSTIFTGNQSWIFGQNNEDFERCVCVQRALQY